MTDLTVTTDNPLAVILSDLNRLKGERDSATGFRRALAECAIAIPKSKFSFAEVDRRTIIANL